MRQTMRCSGAGALACAVILGIAAVAAGQDTRDAEARSLFEAGRTAYASGRFEAALQHFRASYELSGRAALLYNIGSAADRLRRDAEALQAFEQYLAQVPSADNRAEVEARVVVLRRAIGSQPPGPPPPPEQPPEQPPQQPPPAQPTPAVATPADAAQSSAPVGSAASFQQADDGDDGGITSRWWFWTGAVVLTAAVVVAVVLLAGGSETLQGPLEGDDGVVVRALGAP